MHRCCMSNHNSGGGGTPEQAHKLVTFLRNFCNENETISTIWINFMMNISK